MSYRYRILSKSEDWRRERDERSRLEMDLAFVASEVTSLKLRFKTPVIRFITQCDHGDVVMNRSVDGYCFNSSHIFLRTGLPLARLVDVVIHEVRHAWQWAQPRWSGRTDDHCEKDAKLFGLEFWGTRRAETDDEKILPQLCEIGAPLAMDAGDELAAQFYVEELKATGHPAAARLDNQYVEWCRIRERADSPPINTPGANSPAIVDRLRAIRDHYYNVILPARAAAYIKPHMKVLQLESAIREYR